MGLVNKRWGGGCVSSGARCLFPSQSPKQQPTVTHNSPGGTVDDNKTSSASATITPPTPPPLLSFCSASLLITQTISSKMARLAAGLEIYHSHIKVCRIREQVNQVSHELIQVAWIQGTRWLLASMTRSASTCQCRAFSFSFLFSSFHTTSCLSASLRCVFQCSS